MQMSIKIVEKCDAAIEQKRNKRGFLSSLYNFQGQKFGYLKDVFIGRNGKKRKPYDAIFVNMDSKDKKCR